MTSSIVREFLANGALLIALSLAQLFIASHLSRLALLARGVAQGAAFGAAAAIGMLMPVEVVPGVIFDARAMVLGVAGFVGGPVVGLTAGGLAAAMRWSLGGAGALPGVAACMLTALVGIAWRFALGGKRESAPLWPLPLVGLTSAAAALLPLLLLPPDVAPKVLAAATPAMLLVTPPGALLLGWLLSLDARLRRAEREARAAAERFRDFSEAAADWFWETDRELRFSVFSPSLVRTDRLDPMSLLGKARDETDWWTEPPELMQRNREDMERRRPFADFRFFSPRPDGSAAYVSTSGKPVFDEAGGFVGYRGVARDLTPIIEAERREKLANERFRNFAEAAGDWYWEVGPDLRFTYVSDSIERGTGRPPAYYIGKTREELLAGQAPDDQIEAHLATLKRREPFRDFRYSRVCPDGRVHTNAVSGRPLFENGVFMGYRGVGSDVTEIERQNAKAAETESSFRESIDSLEEGLLRFDRAGRVTAVNRAMNLIYPDLADVLRPGAQYEAIVRATVDRMVIDVPPGEREDWVRRRLLEWSADSGERELQLSNGRWIRFADRRTPDGGVVSIRVDITNIRERERQLAERTEQLSVSLESIEEGVSVLDAELRLVSWNALFAELSGVPGDALRVGMSCAELMLMQARAGLFGPVEDVVETVRRRMEQMPRREPHDETFHLAGRSIDLRRRPLASGGYMSSLRDVTKERRREEELTRRASRDPLTGLANRTSFEEALDGAFAAPERSPIALLFIDLDRFKEINDGIGHEAGDLVLREIARRLASCMRPDDLPARLGGDEFVVLLTGEAARTPEVIVGRLQSALLQPIAVDGEDLLVTASIGVARSRDGDDRASLMRAADGEMYRAKRAARVAGEAAVPAPVEDSHLKRTS